MHTRSISDSLITKSWLRSHLDDYDARTSTRSDAMEQLRVILNVTEQEELPQETIDAIYTVIDDAEEPEKPAADILNNLRSDLHYAFNWQEAPFPDELFEKFFSYLHGKELLPLRNASKSLHACTSNFFQTPLFNYTAEPTISKVEISEGRQAIVSPAGDVIATARGGLIGPVWLSSIRGEKQQITPSASRPYLAFSKNNQFIISQTDGCLYFFTCTLQKPLGIFLYNLKPYVNDSLGFLVTPLSNGEILCASRRASGSKNAGFLGVLYPKNGAFRKQATTAQYDSAQISSDETLLALRNTKVKSEQFIDLYDVETRKHTQRLLLPNLTCFAITRKNNIITVNKNQEIQLWNSTTGELLNSISATTLSESIKSIHHIAVSSNDIAFFAKQKSDEREDKKLVLLMRLNPHTHTLQLYSSLPYENHLDNHFDRKVLFTPGKLVFITTIIGKNYCNTYEFPRLQPNLRTNFSAAPDNTADTPKPFTFK